MKLVILSWNAKGGGRAKALLSIADYCSKQLDVTVALGGDWHTNQLAGHHGIDPECEFIHTNFRGDKAGQVERIVEKTNPDVILAFDTLLINACREIDTPTIGYLRTKTVPGVESYFAPSKRCAEYHNEELEARGEPRCKPVYPIWYITKQTELPPFEERPIDILVHGRKVNDALEKLSGCNILLANNFDYDTLSNYYRQSKLFLFPKKDRFEPLGLMPIEANAYGCRLAITENSGVAECFPSYSFETPSDHVERLLNEAYYDQPDIPESPTDPIEEVRKLANCHS